MTFVPVESGWNLADNCSRSLSAGRSNVSYRRTLFTIILLLGCVSMAAARDLAVVANNGNPTRELTVAEFVKICKAQTNHWSDGKSVTLVMRSPAVPEMKVFLEKVYEMPESEVNQLIASANRERANHAAIVIATSDDDLVNKVASLPGAIGVVDVYAINSSVRVLKLGGKLPLEPGYLLHGN